MQSITNQHSLKYSPTLLQNGAFTSGISSWFGSYLRHEKVTATTGHVRPEYAAVITAGLSTDYLPGVEPGISQFVDLPDIYTYPSPRAAADLELRYIGNETYVLSILASTTLNGELLNGRHPFVHEGTEVGVGVNLQVNSPQTTRECRTGSVFYDSSTQNHTLQISGPLTQSLLQSTQLQGVTVTVGGPNTAGFGVVVFTGTGHESLLTFIRPNGSGLKIGDTLVVDGRVVVIDSVASSLNTDVNNGGPSYNATYRTLLGAPSITELVETKDWQLYESELVSVEYSMPLYRYDYSLSYLYSLENGDKPGVSKLQFRALNQDNSITGYGVVVEELNPVEALDRDVVFDAVSPWRRNHHYFSTESAEPIDGRLMVNIPPPTPSTQLEGRQITDVTYFSNHTAEIRYTLPAEPGELVSRLEYDGSSLVTADTPIPSSLEVDDLIHVTGVYNAISATSWLPELLITQVPSKVVSVTPTQVVFEIPQGITGSASFAAGLSTTTVRLSNQLPTIPRLEGNDLALLTGGSVQGSWIQPLFESPITISTPSRVLSTLTAFSVEMVVTFDWPINLIPGPTPLDLTGVEIARSSAVEAQCRISDVKLQKGHTYSTISVSGSMEDLTSLVDEEANIVPKGMVVLYAGGGACPAGYEAIQNFADTTVREQGLRTIHDIPAPDSLTYDVETGISTLNYQHRTFDQLDENGEAIVLEGTARYITSEVPGAVDSSGNPITQQLELLRVRQSIEPGMILRTDNREDVIEYNSLVTGSSTDFSLNDYMAPFTYLDRGYLVTDIKPLLDTEQDATPQGSARATKENQPFASDEGFSTYGGGYGEITYPVIDPGEYTVGKQGNPNQAQSGPSFDHQTNVFPIPGKPFVYLNVSDRSDGDGFAGTAENIYRATTYTSIGSTFEGVSIQGTVVSEATDAAPDLLGNDTIRSGDIFFCSLYVPNVGLFDSFPCMLQKRGGSGWYIFRYDLRQHKLFNLGGTLQNVFHGDEFALPGSVAVLRPCKLYGTPGQTQVLTPFPGITNLLPLGTGTGFTQSRSNISGQDVWITRFIQLGTQINVLGDLDSDRKETYYVEPSGYLRHDTPTNRLDYGNSGHVHDLSTGGTSISLALPKVDRTRYTRYGVLGLPNQHGHALPGGVVYPLPEAKLFTICQKL